MSTVLVVKEGVLGRKTATSGMDLQAGDRLIGNADNAIAQVDCPGAPAFTLEGRFEALILPITPAPADESEGKPECGIEVLSGDGVATTPTDAKETARMNGGGVGMVSKHTQFGISLQRDPKNKDARQMVAFTLDGTATCKDETGKTWTIENGNQLDLETRTKSAIDAQRLTRLATTFTSLDLSQQDADAATRKQLEASWLAVLSRPNDPSARVDLAAVQSKAQVHSSRVSEYQRSRAGTLATQSANPELIQRYQKLNMTKQSEVPNPQADRPKPPSSLTIQDRVSTPAESR